MMKKLFFLWVFAAMGFVVSAQTDFRDLSLKVMGGQAATEKAL